MQMTWENVLLLLTILSLTISIYYNIRNARRGDTKDQRDEGRTELEDARADAQEAQAVANQLAQLNTELQKQGLVIGNVNGGINDIRLEMRSQRDVLTSIMERLTRVEESSKQAHKRIDRIDPITARATE